MNQNDPSGLVRMFDDFRSGTALQYKRRSSTYLGNPLPMAVPLTPVDRAKRPFDETLLNDNAMLIKKSKKSDSLFDDSLTNSFDSPWELSHLKSQLTQARAEIKALESRISQLHGLRKEAELLFEQEKNSLKSTIDQERNNIQQLERRVSVMKRREDKLKDDIAALIEKMNSDQGDRDTKTYELYDENTELKHKNGELEEKLQEKEQLLRALQTEKLHLESEVKLTNEKVSTMNTELAKLRQTVAELEKTKAALADAQLTIKEMESARKSYEEMDLMVKSQRAKLMRYSELERNLKHLVNQNNKLKEGSSNAVHLESLVEEMSQRLKTLEEREKDIVQLRIDLGVADGKLSEYRTLAQQVVGEGGGAMQLTSYVRQLQSKSLLSASQISHLTNQVKNLEETEKLTQVEITKLKREIEKMKDEMNTTNNNLRRLKKQNLLITWERNDLRSLTDSYQKEVTLGGHTSSSEGRIELLEKIIDGYRDRINQLEADPSLITPAVGSSVSSSVIEKEKPAELEKLRSENQALKEKVEKLEYEMEHRSLKGDFNTLNTKILHFKMNPTTEAIESREDELVRLRKELFEKNERLKMYSEGNINDVTQVIAQRQDIAKEVTELREKVKSQETVNQRLKEAFKTKGHEFREAVFALLGYKVDGLPNSLYRLSNLYAEHQEQYLMFKMTATGMELLETEYSKALGELVEEVLLRHHSIPVFLSTLTMDLFKKQSHSLMTTSSIG